MGAVRSQHPLSEILGRPAQVQKLINLFLDPEFDIIITQHPNPGGWPLLDVSGIGLDGEENQLLVYQDGYFIRNKRAEGKYFKFWQRYSSASLEGRVYSMLYDWSYDLDPKYMIIAKRYRQHCLRKHF